MFWPCRSGNLTSYRAGHGEAKPHRAAACRPGKGPFSRCAPLHSGRGPSSVPAFRRGAERCRGGLCRPYAGGAGQAVCRSAPAVARRRQTAGLVPCRIDAGKTPGNEKIPVRASILRRQGVGVVLLLCLYNKYFSRSFHWFFQLFHVFPAERSGLIIPIFPLNPRFHCFYGHVTRFNGSFRFAW